MIDTATAYSLEFVGAALPEQASRLLEIGCGTGELAAALVRRGFEVVAVDMDEGAVAQAHAAGVDAREAEWPEFSCGTFDAILFIRSLHHVRDLPASLDAAFAAVRPGGRVIVEDFMAEGGSARSEAWFASFARLLRDARLLPHPTPFLARCLGEAEPDGNDHDHDLHDSGAIEAALHARGRVSAAPSAYYFRYLLPALGLATGLGATLLAHELALIEAGVIDALGRRYVATV